MKVYQIVENEDSFACPFCDHICHNNTKDFKYWDEDWICDRCKKEFVACLDKGAPYGKKDKMIFLEGSYGYDVQSKHFWKNAHGENIDDTWYSNNRKTQYGRNSGLEESILLRSFK